MRRSLGLLEVAGLLSAVSVADVMLKTANTQLLAMEKAKGNGWTTVKIEGGVDAVHAAVDAGVVMAKQMNAFVSSKVIARPDEAVFKLFGLNQVERQIQKEEVAISELEVEIVEPAVNKEEVELVLEDEEVEEVTLTLDVIEEEMITEEVTPDATCNLCQESDCERKKGEPKTRCLHQ
jgi:microcompartment protein CcmL/EutN